MTVATAVVMPQLGCKKPRKPRTHCFRGHELTEENTGWQVKQGKRFCLTCERERKIARRLEDPEGVRQAQRLKMAEWRKKNVEHHKASYTALRAAKKAWSDNYKQEQGCGFCPEKHPACLDYHHIDPEKKEVNVSWAISKWSLERLQTEIAKCVVICANCHRKFHWDERQQEST